MVMEREVQVRRSVEEVLRDFRGRRKGIIEALTTDLDEFYRLCDPAKENLCLYGFPDGQWEVNLPAEEVPAELPEPALGINFARDGMQLKDWLDMVAAHSDAWLLSVAVFFCARFRFKKAERKRVFKQIVELPTIVEVVAMSQEERERPSNPIRRIHSNLTIEVIRIEEIDAREAEEMDEERGLYEQGEDEHEETF